MKGFRNLIAVAAAFMLSAAAFAEENDRKDRSQGFVTGSFETNTNVYLKDAKTLAAVSDGDFGMNNYLKVDYYPTGFAREA